MRSGVIVIVLVATALAGAGCVIDPSGDPAGDPVDDVKADEPQTGEARQELGSFGIWSWGCSSAPCGLDLGLVAGQTCFLAGVWGNLQPAGSYSQVQVLQSDGHWGLQIVPSGHPLGGTAVCVPGTMVKTGSWSSGQPEVSLGSGATRRCFLSGVINTDGFTASSDFVQVRKVGSTWFLGGNMPSSKTVRAVATCVDVPAAANDFGLVVSDGGSFLNVPIQDNNPWGWACGIKKLGGHFTTNSYNDGVWIGYNNGISMWELNAVNGKQVATDCVK
jgi:hypothetical protein